ncbi:MAG: 3-deoxy-7-phosphoheptulonate synthase [Pseudomonadota bacterium]|jgi:3-deoxy-7-phosphoheptulonate synthase|nr:3-deoxy-7-phosphoheptulonate synthase [Burkholderiales bacterium]
MAYTVIRKIPSHDEIIAEFPLSATALNKISQDRQEIKDILNGKDNRLIIVVGPCSAWPAEAVLKYAEQLLQLNELVKHKLKVVMRVYIQKPRTVKGWVGPVNQPNPLLPPDISVGIKYARKLMVQVVEMGMPIADEALFTHNSKGFMELLSWVAIGARSSEDQEHRIFASAIDCAVGIKNPTNGSIKIGVNGVIAAQHSHTSVFDGYEIKTDGNNYAHLVLRGGDGIPNYSLEHLLEAKKHFIENKIQNPGLIIDVSHDNCIFNGKKDYRRQPAIILEVLENIKNNQALNGLIKGFMIESFIKPGNQNVDAVESIDVGGLSITDPCLGFDETKTLLLDIVKMLH